MNPLHQGIAALAAHGRFGDDTLMHVSRHEVAALEGLGALTRNPVTGLSEAFGWIDAAQMIATGVATVYGGPAAGAAVNGAITAKRTGSLGQGMLTGIGTFGLGSLAGTAAGTTPGAVAGQGVSSAATDTATNGMLGAGGVGTAGTAAAAPSAAPLAGSDALLGQMPDAAGTGVTGATQGAGTSAAGQGGLGASNAAAKPTLMDATGRANAQANLGSTDYIQQHMPSVYAAGAGFYGSSMLAQRQHQQEMQAQMAADAKAKKDQQLASFGQAIKAAHQINPYAQWYQPGNPMASTAGYATGGMTGDGGLYGMHMHRPHIHDDMSTHYGAAPFATGGLSGDNGRWIPQEAKEGPHGIEGLLRGPGDGMSDDIPAHIDGHTPARLAEGEFVVPADVVSHLGNGSTSAGAKHLYDMLERIRKARVGHANQGKEIDPHEHLPA
jgi:hypothetical protein